MKSPLTFPLCFSPCQHRGQTLLTGQAVAFGGKHPPAPNSFLTKALTELVNPKPKKFTHWQLKYSSQKNTALQEPLRPLTAGLGPQRAAAPQAWASSRGRPGQPCLGHPPSPFWLKSFHLQLCLLGVEKISLHSTKPSCFFLSDRSFCRCLPRPRQRCPGRVRLLWATGLAGQQLPGLGEHLAPAAGPRPGSRDSTPWAAWPHGPSPLETSLAMHSLGASSSAAARLRVKKGPLDRIHCCSKGWVKPGSGQEQQPWGVWGGRVCHQSSVPYARSPGASRQCRWGQLRVHTFYS